MIRRVPPPKLFPDRRNLIREEVVRLNELDKVIEKAEGGLDFTREFVAQGGQLTPEREAEILRILAEAENAKKEQAAIVLGAQVRDQARETN